MADAAVSKTVVERRASSTLASGTILNLKSRLLRKSAFLFKSLRLGATRVYVSARIPLWPRSRFQKRETNLFLKLVSFEGVNDLGLEGLRFRRQHKM